MRDTLHASPRADLRAATGQYSHVCDEFELLVVQTHSRPTQAAGGGPDGHRISSGDIRRHCPLRVHTRQSLAGRAGARDRCTTRRAARRSRKRPTRHRRRNRRSVKHRCAETMRDSSLRRAAQIFQRPPRRHCTQVCRYISTHARVYVRRWPPALPAAPAPNFLEGARCSPCSCAAVHGTRV